MYKILSYQYINIIIVYAKIKNTYVVEFNRVFLVFAFFETPQGI